MNIFYIQMI